MITAPTEFSGLQVWLDASDTTRLFQLSGGTTAVAANLDPVGYWGDKSGNNRHFTNIGGSATTRPTWVSSLSTVRFDGSNDYLSSFFNITYTAQTVFMVMKVVAGNNTRPFLQNQGGSSPQPGTAYYQPFYHGGATITSFASNLSSGGTSNSPISPRLSNNFDLFCSTHTGTSIRNVLNGAGSTTASHILNYTVTQTRIGGSTDAVTSSSVVNGNISEVIVYNRALTNVERADVEYYLTRKWNFLNSIPRQVYGIKNGLWSLTDTWSVSAEPSPWNFPLSADNAYTNTFTITADSSTQVSTIRNSTLAPNILSGGSFVLADGVSLSANVVGGVAPYTLTLMPAASSTLVGNLTGGTGTNAICLSSSDNSYVEIVGSVTGGGATGNGVNNNAKPTSKVIIYGNVFGSTTSSGAAGVQTGNGGYVKIVGDVFSGTGNTVNAVRCETGLTGSQGTVEVFGNLYGGSGVTSAAVGTTNGNVSVIGNIYAGTNTGSIGLRVSHTGAAVPPSVILSGGAIANNLNYAVEATTTFVTPLSVYGNIINAPNGRQAIYAPRYQVFPTGSAQYTRQASNGYDSFVDYWTSNSTFSYPASSDVVLGTTYSNSTLSGSMAVPSPSSVALGAPVGTTTGTASITVDNVLGQPIANLTTPNSIGARLKNITTSQALSAIVDSLEF